MSNYVITNPTVAKNPVARAIARAKVHKILLHAKLQIYTLTQGQPCADLLTGSGFVLTLFGMAGEIDPAVGPQDSRVRIVRGALSGVNQMLRTNQWDAAQAVALEQGLVQAEDLNRVVQAKYVLDAWAQMPGGAP